MQRAFTILHSGPAPTPRLAAALLLSILAALFLLAGCASGATDAYLETFDEPGGWSTGGDNYSVGQVVDGTYDLTITEPNISRWAAAGQSFSNGVFEVEATPTEGPLDNGYGLLLRADPAKGSFYLFKVSSDGFVWIGRYRDGVEDGTIIGTSWFESSAVEQGLGVTNRLRVQAEAGNLIFFVNDQEVGRVTDNTFTSGDVGLLVQSLGEAGVRVRFDNLSVNPSQS